MGEERKVLSVSDLLHRFLPVTGASSLSPTISRPVTPPTLDNTSDRQKPNNYITLKPLNYPTSFIGTLTLPSISCSNAVCFQFTDQSATIFCDILDLDLRIIGKRIKVLAWNYLPTKSYGGFLEIIKWSLDQSEMTSLLSCNAFHLNSDFPAAYEEKWVARYFVYGVLDSVSPVSKIPCTNDKNDTRNLTGFLARVFVCECKLCCSKDKVIVLKDITEEHNKDHNFTKPEIVYFCGSATIWYSAISRLIGQVVLVSGMKKKLVFLGKEESLMMYVTAEKSVIHYLPSPSKQAFRLKNTNIRKKRKCSAYTGSVTGVYMQGMVIELDHEVFLLIDHQLLIPHSLRVGAIVTVRNFHLVNPKFSWAKVHLIGACIVTSIHVNVFSPIESRCYQILQSQSLLRKFIESLAFSAKFWVLLVVSSLREKFAGILSELEILGSKYEEGLVQKYSSSCLPLSIFRSRNGVFKEYCQHELRGCSEEHDYKPPKLVVSISNFICQCEDAFIKILYASGTDSGAKHCNGHITCEEKSPNQPIRKLLKSEDMNVVLLGVLKISKCSGRLQLFDATGSLDIVIPDLSSVWSVNDIYEIYNFVVVMEGTPEQLENLESVTREPFSCRNIFNHIKLSEKRRFSIYIYCHLRDAQSMNHLLRSSIDKEEIFKELESGKFHMLRLMHKFPVLQKFPGDDVISNSSSLYAEAIVLPWNLFILRKDRDSVESYVRGNEQQYTPFRRCIREKASTATDSAGFSDASSNLSEDLQCLNSDCQSCYKDKKSCDLSCPHELPYKFNCQILIDKSMVSLGILWNFTVANVQGNSPCKTAARKLLLEFRSDSVLRYELLKIGGYYMIKHDTEDMLCTMNDSNNINNDTVVVSSKSHLWRVLFTTNDAPPNVDQSHIITYHTSYVNEKEVKSENTLHDEFSFSRSSDGCPEICPDIYVDLSADHLKFLEDEVNGLKEDCFMPTISSRKLVSMESEGFNVDLPEGNLLSVRGHVVAIHNSDYYLNHQILHGTHHQTLHGVASSVCIHVLVDRDIVKIYSSLSKHSYPIGFGPGVEADFHRVLLTAGGGVLKLTPVSSIEIKSIVIDNDLCGNDGASVRSAVENTTSSETGPASLISEIMQFSDHKQMRLSCEVVAVYVLVLEKNNELSTTYLGTHPVKIPLAGFVVDDGSSSCCCWTDNERAVTLLRLHELLPHKYSKNPLKSNKGETEIPSIDTMSRMSKIIDQHGTIVMKIHGSLSDTSCQDVAVSVNSDSVVSKSDEEFLKSVILKACSSNTWNVVGSVLDSRGVKKLEERLQMVDMLMLPLQNIWASEVSHLDMVTEGRNILQELLKSK